MLAFFDERGAGPLGDLIAEKTRLRS